MNAAADLLAAAFSKRPEIQPIEQSTLDKIIRERSLAFNYSAEALSVARLLGGEDLWAIALSHIIPHSSRHSALFAGATPAPPSTGPTPHAFFFALRERAKSQNAMALSDVGNLNRGGLGKSTPFAPTSARSIIM